jgi:hypothetical protein
MEIGNMNKKNIAFALFALGLLWWLFFGGSEKWKEEVQLSDGRIIVIQRETIHEGGGGEIVSNRSGTKPKERRIRFTHPDGSGKMIEWKSTKLSPRTWPEKPLILDLESGQPVIYAIVAISPGCEVYSRYVYKDGNWTEETLPKSFPERKTNLLLRDGVDMPRSVDLEDKQKMNSEIGTFKSLKKVGPNREICG